MASSYAGSGKKVLSAQVAYKGGINIETLAAGVTMDAQSSNLQVLDPDGSNRTIVLPAEETNDGLWFSFRNSGSTGNLVINNDAAATVLTLNPGESGTVGCDGSAWAKAFEGTPALADFGATGMKADVVAESTSAAGVTVDGLLIKDGAIRGLQTVGSGAAAITTTRMMTLADAGGVFSVAQSSAYDIDLPSPTTGPGCRYVFHLTSPGAFNVTITVTGAAATFVGTIVNDVTSVLPATGSTLTFATGAAALGDTIEIVSISTGLYLVRAVSSAAGGITVS